MAEQLLLFQESKEEKLEREFNELKDKCEKMRRSLYARNNKLEKLIFDARYDLDVIIAGISKGQINPS